MTNRRKPAQRSTGTDWKPTRPRGELAKAIGASSGIVVVTALLIFLMKPDDATETPSTGVPVTTQTQPAPSTVATQPDATATSSTVPPATTATTTPPTTTAPTTNSQP